jgi:site-specific DNA recombinase
MKKAVIYARVSSKDQEREGYSIPAQLKLLREYGVRNEMEIAHEFVDVETAKTTGRKRFGEMVRFFEQNPNTRCVIVEKTDRLYRNFRDCVTLEDLEVQIHLVKEGQVIEKNARSQAKLIHGMQTVIARHYIDNLREEVCKGMREKAEQGIYPSRPPLGYKNNKLEHTIEIDSPATPIAKRIFELYATGKYSLASLRKQIQAEFGKKLAKGYLHRLLKNPFYGGFFVWEGKKYQGTQAIFIDPAIFQRTQEILNSSHRPKLHRHEFAFSGLLTCAFDHCAVTAEIKKGRYVYYHCTGYRGKCALPYMREEAVGEQLGQVLKNIHIPDEVLGSLQDSLAEDSEQVRQESAAQRIRLEQRLAAVRRRIDQVYLDKLDGKISEEFWEQKNAEWQEEAIGLALALRAFSTANPDRLLTANRILELANKAYSLYLGQNAAERGKLLRIVLSNCATDGVSLYPAYTKPFDLIFERAKTEEWCARRDSNSRPIAPEAIALSI